MRADHVFKVIDVHAGGAPSRLIYSGLPPLVGETTMEKMRYFAAHHDWIRKALVLEPRGGSLTSAVVLMPPSRHWSRPVRWLRQAPRPWSASIRRRA